MVGHCDHIEIQILSDESVSIQDNGRGIPVDNHKTENMPALEVVMTKLHAGGKFDHKSYKVSGGLHGVGVSVVNALSEFLEVEVYLEGKVYFQRYERGDTKSELAVIRETKRRGTRIYFRPDPAIFDNIHFGGRQAEMRGYLLYDLPVGCPLNRKRCHPDLKLPGTQFFNSRCACFGLNPNFKMNFFPFGHVSLPEANHRNYPY